MAESDLLREAVANAGRGLELGRAIGRSAVVTRAGDGVAHAVGLQAATFEELVAFDSGGVGMAYDLSPEDTGIVLLSGETRIAAGEGVRALGRLPSLPVGPELLGRVIDPLGTPLDDGAPLSGPLRPIFAAAPEFLERKPVDQPLHTGVLVLDAAIPIGRGQRELIVGDRNVGKTALALDILGAQRAGDVACVYVAIGQPMTRILAIRDSLERLGVLGNTVILAAEASLPPGMQYLAPYAGMAIAEGFRSAGGHAVVAFDDLTKHADAYRQLALLLDRPAGREAFPGDIFYVHAELLERAAAWRAEAGGGSITAFPIVETNEGDISAYIPTNLISITDGQIYLDTERYERDLRPAVDIGRSVSRIGAMAQPRPIRESARNLRIEMSRFESLEALTRVGLDLEEGTRRALARGRVLRELLRQKRFSALSVGEQALILAVAVEALTGGPLERVHARVAELLMRARTGAPELMRRLDAGELPEGWREQLRALAQAMPAEPVR